MIVHVVTTNYLVVIIDSCSVGVTSVCHCTNIVHRTIRIQKGVIGNITTCIGASNYVSAVIDGGSLTSSRSPQRPQIHHRIIRH